VGETSAGGSNLGTDADVSADFPVNAAGNVEHRQRHDKGLHPQPCGARPVAEAEQRADQHADRDDLQRAEVVPRQQQRGDGRADAEQRTDGQVDPGGEDDQRLADRQDAPGGESSDGVGEVLLVPEDLSLGQDPEGDHQDEPDVAL